MENQRNYQILNQFNGMECTIFSRPIGNDAVDTQYISKSFYFEVDKHFLTLRDATNDMVKTCIRLSEIDIINNLGEDVYKNLIRIITSYDITYYIKTIEKKPTPIHCDKCGCEFKEEDQTWFIHQQGEWSSRYDGDWISKKLCDNCVMNFIGEVSDNSGEYIFS